MDAMPLSVTLDEAGNDWYIGSRSGSIGQRGSEPGDITAYEIPDPAARDP